MRLSYEDGTENDLDVEMVLHSSGHIIRLATDCGPAIPEGEPLLRELISFFHAAVIIRDAKESLA